MKNSSKKPRAKKEKPSEADLVHSYANKIIDGKIARGHLDKRFDWHKRAEGMTNKDAWLDTDFFFSVVFQSSEQKYKFLEEFCAKFGLQIDGGQIQILNGMVLASNLGIELPKVTVEESPYGDPELKDLILDDSAL